MSKHTNPAAKPPPLGGFRLNDATAIYEPLPAARYIVEGAVRRASLCLLGGYGSSGKTWLATDLHVAVGTGGSWLGRFPCERGRATFLDYESGDHELRRRVQAVTAARGGYGAELPSIDFASFPDTYATKRDFEDRLGELATHRELVIIDSLAAMTPGIDENSADMRRALDPLRRVAERTGCAFFVLLHAKKGGEGVDPREQFRGSSAIFDAADIALAVSVDREGAITVRQTKARYGRALEPFGVRIEDRDGGVSVVAGDMATSAGPDRLASLADAIVRIVWAERGCSMRRIRDTVKGRGEDVDRTVRDLEERGVIANRGTANRAAYWPGAANDPTQAG